MKKVLIGTINVYQKTLSPDHGLMRHRHPNGFCRFYPSCSEYTKLAIKENGSLLGVWLGIKRVGRCTPWTKPAVDLSYLPEYTKIVSKKGKHV